MNEFTLLAETTWADGWVAIIQATISAIVLQTLEPLEADKVLDIIIAWPPK